MVYPDVFQQAKIGFAALFSTTAIFVFGKTAFDHLAALGAPTIVNGSIINHEAAISAAG